MNKERMYELADMIEKLDYKSQYNPTEDLRGFNMADYKFECGTPSCIAGWAAFIWNGDVYEYCNQNSIHIEAGKILGLSPDDADYLFYGSWSPKAISGITPAEAAAELRRLADTGKQISIVDLPPVYCDDPTDDY